MRCEMCGAGGPQVTLLVTSDAVLCRWCADGPPDAACDRADLANEAALTWAQQAEAVAQEEATAGATNW